MRASFFPYSLPPASRGRRHPHLLPLPANATSDVPVSPILQHLDVVNPDEPTNEAAQQLAFADLILLNKTDLVQAPQIEKVIKAIRGINAAAEIIQCQLNSPSGRPPLDRLLGTDRFSVKKALEVDPAFLDADSEEDAGSMGSLEEELLSREREHAEADAAAHAATATSGEARRSMDVKLPGKRLASEQAQSDAEAQQCERRALSGTACTGNCDKCHIFAAADSEDGRAPKRTRKKLHDLSNICSVAITAHGPLDEYL